SVVLGQDQSAATTKDVIFARKIAMGSIAAHMDEIDTMLQTGKIDLPRGQEHADGISVLLMAFPHLFPPGSNQWKPGEKDPGTDTFASPEVWSHYRDFYEFASLGAKAAYSASRADNEGDFRKYGAALRASCDGCHAAFLKND